MKINDKKESMSLTEGTLFDKILIFALPIAASSILQQLFNSADVAVVGRFADKNALAAVGSNGPIINLLVNLFVGLSVGANVMISRFIGSKNEKKISEAIHTSVLLALISGAFLAVLGFFISRPMLELMKSPDEIIELADIYLKIYFVGMPFQMLYNFEAAILRSKGDTGRPMIALIVAGIVNVILNVFFVIILHMSVSGVATATVISQMISSGILMRALLKEEGCMKLDLHKLKIDKGIITAIARIGIPAGLQGMVFSISNLCIQSQINDLGPDTAAASAAALNYEMFVYYLINAFGQASVTFTGQNYGAGKMERCEKTVKLSLLSGGIFTVLMCAVFLIFAYPLANIYTPEPDVIRLAVVRMKWILSFELLNLAMEVFSGSMRGFGCSLIPALIAIFGVCGVRILWVYTVYKIEQSFQMLLIVYPISWLVTAAAIIISYFITKKRLKLKVYNQQQKISTLSQP